MCGRSTQSGFSLLEVVVVMSIFLVVTGAVFGLLNVAQSRYRSEQQILDILQNARLGIDLLTRDINRAGYPPLNSYDPASPGWIAAGGVPVTRLATPFVGMTGGAINPACIVDTAIPPALSTCVIPNNFELIIETDLDPDNIVTPAQVEWVYYRLDTPGNPPPPAAPAGGGATRTLYRAVSTKTVGGNPTTAGILVPFVENVVNDPAVVVAVGGPNPPLFTFVCAGGAPTCTPNNIVEIGIVLQAQANVKSMGVASGGLVHALTLQSVARRMNPPQ